MGVGGALERERVDHGLVGAVGESRENRSTGLEHSLGVGRERAAVVVAEHLPVPRDQPGGLEAGARAARDAEGDEAAEGGERLQASTLADWRSPESAALPVASASASTNDGSS